MRKSGAVSFLANSRAARVPRGPLSKAAIELTKLLVSLRLCEKSRPIIKL